MLQALNNEIGNSPPLILSKDELKLHPVYMLRAQLIGQRREHLKLLGLKRVAKQVLTVEQIKTRYESDDTGSGKGEL